MLPASAFAAAGLDQYLEVVPNGGGGSTGAQPGGGTGPFFNQVAQQRGPLTAARLAALGKLDRPRVSASDRAADAAVPASQHAVHPFGLSSLWLSTGAQPGDTGFFVALVLAIAGAGLGARYVRRITFS